MDFARRSQLVTNIISGYTVLSINQQKYVVKYPSVDLSREAEDLYQEVLYKHRFEPWLTKKQVENHLRKIGLLTEDTRDIERHIENLKMDLFASRLKFKEVEKIKKSLKSVRHKYDKIQDLKSCLDDYTIEGYAEVAKFQYLIINTTYVDDKRFWFDKKHYFDMKDVGYHQLQKIIGALSHEQLSVSQLRELSRTDPWTTYYRIDKNPFNVPPVYLNDVQRTLLLFSQMYVNAYEQPDYPGDDIEKDDDMFDGWSITMRKKYEKERNAQQIDKTVGDKHPGAQELFVPVDNAKAAKKINEMNTIQGKIVKKQRQAFIKKKGTAVDGELPDKKLEKRMQATQQYMQSVKDKRHG